MNLSRRMEMLAPHSQDSWGDSVSSVTSVAMAAIATINVAIITIIQEFSCYAPTDSTEFFKPEPTRPVSKIFLCS